MKPGKFLATICTSFFLLAAAGPALAFDFKETYPRLANYYLQPNVPYGHFEELAKYDLVILDVDTQTIDPSLFTTLKEKNPKIQTLAYIPSQSVNVQDLGDWARFRRLTYEETNAKNRWLKDAQGNFVYFSSTWPTIRFVDIGNGWSDYLSDLAAKDVMPRGMWDGIFYDMVFYNVSWLNGGNIDLNKDGQKDDLDSVNRYWQENSRALIEKTKTKTGQPVVANVDIPGKYDSQLDGIMMENFPAGWLGPNGWSILENNYLNGGGKEKITIINSTNDNGKVMTNYRKMRYGLSSTLLGDGYYAFDSGDQNHAQTWWYDEYDVNLGKAVAPARNLLDAASTKVKAGLWRRDFENGIALVNSTSAEQKYVFAREQFEKISGRQDRSVNNGAKVNWVKLAPGDGLVMLKAKTEVLDGIFANGSFMRVFDAKGAQTRNGFFAYQDGYPGDAQLLIADLDNDRTKEVLVNGQGEMVVYRGGKQVNRFAPFDKNFKKTTAFAVADFNRDGLKEIVVAPGAGGGPQVRTFSSGGRLLSAGFFAFDKNFRGGLSLAAGDVNGDRTEEIIAAMGKGGAPEVRIFSQSGKLLKSFFAYDKNFRGGVSLAAGDVNGDNRAEIITAPGAGGGPHVRIFDASGRLLGQFFAYEKNFKSGVRVTSSDLDRDGVQEIYVSTENLVNL